MTCTILSKQVLESRFVHFTINITNLENVHKWEISHDRDIYVITENLSQNKWLKL